MVAMTAAAAPGDVIPYVAKEAEMGAAALAAVWHSLAYCPPEGQEADFGEMAVSWAAVTVMGAREIRGAARMVGRTATSAGERTAKCIFVMANGCGSG